MTTPEVSVAAKIWYYGGFAFGYVVVASVPASIIEAVWSGEWRWLILTAISVSLLKWIIRHG